MRIYLRPSNPEIKVRNPITGVHLPLTGQEVEESSYWTRRLMDGDVVLGPPVESAPTHKKKKEWAE